MARIDDLRARSDDQLTEQLGNIYLVHVQQRRAQFAVAVLLQQLFKTLKL